MKPTRTVERPSASMLGDAPPPGVLERTSRWALAAPERRAPLERWAGAGFVLGGITIAAAISIQLLVGQGHHVPNFAFRALHLLGPIALVGPAAGGFLLTRSRLGRWLSAITIGLITIQAGWDRFLPSPDWTVPRLLLAGGLIVGGLWLLTRPIRRSRAAV